MPQPLIGPGDLIINSWQNFRRNARVYADFVVWFTLLAVVQWALWVVARNLVADRMTRTVVLAIISLPTAVIAFGLTAAVIDATARGVQKKAISIRESLSMGAHRLLPFIWVSVLSGLIVVLGLLLFLIPGLIFLVWYRFSQNFVIVDDVRGTGALAASKRLVSGRFWAVFLRVAAPALFFYVAGSFVTALTYLLIGAALGDPGLFFGQATDVDALNNTHTLVTSVVPQIVNALVLPLWLGSDLLLWFDLKKTAPPSSPLA